MTKTNQHVWKVLLTAFTHRNWLFQQGKPPWFHSTLSSAIMSTPILEALHVHDMVGAIIFIFVGEGANCHDQRGSIGDRRGSPRISVGQSTGQVGTCHGTVPWKFQDVFKKKPPFLR